MTLSTKDLGYWYEDNRRLFENVNLTFEKGKMYAILGTSGSGKTTFLSLIAGLDTPKSGFIGSRQCGNSDGDCSKPTDK